MSSDNNNNSNILLGIGNPLLDISANVEPALLTKYNVKLNDAILAGNEHLGIYDELISNYNVEYIAGGATQNTIRVAQWCFNKANSTAYIGCVGKDKYADILRKEATKDGVNVYYYEDEKNSATGTCAVLVVNKERSLIANLSAANNYKIDHLLTDPIQTLIKSSSIFYSAGFFLTVSPPSLMHIAKHACDNNKIFSGNLSAPFISEFFDKPLLEAIPYYDFLFGNESEALAFAKKQGFDSNLSLSDIALKLSQYPKKNESRARYVIITQGSNSTIVAYKGSTNSYIVPAVAPELIVDVNGAGDAFVGGFLSVLMRVGYDKLNIEEAVQTGHYAARTIIQVSGTALKGKPDYTFTHQ